MPYMWFNKWFNDNLREMRARLNAISVIADSTRDSVARQAFSTYRNQYKTMIMGIRKKIGLVGK